MSKGLIAAVRTSNSADEVANLLAQSRRAVFHSRDTKSAAIHLMSCYGYTDGVDVPRFGRFRVIYLEDGVKILELVP